MAKRGTYHGGSAIIKPTKKERQERAGYLNTRTKKHLMRQRQERDRVNSLWADPDNEVRIIFAHAVDFFRRVALPSETPLGQPSCTPLVASFILRRDHMSPFGTERTSWAGLSMSVDWDRPEVSGRRSKWRD
jgi:hypothetical protein